MYNRKLHLFFAIALLLFINQLYAQRLLSQGMYVDASSLVSGTRGIWLTDGNDYPAGAGQFCQTNKDSYQWIEIPFSTEFRITKVVLYDGNFGNAGDFNTNLYVVATNNASDYTNYPQGTAINTYLNSIGRKGQKLNDFSDGTSTTDITEFVQGNYIRIWDYDGGGIRLAEVKIYGIEPGSFKEIAKPVSVAINTGNRVATETASTATVSTSERITQAISKKDNASLNTLLKNNPESFTQQHVDDAFVNGQVEQGKTISAKTGIKPSQGAVNSLLNANKSAVVLDLLNTSVIEGNTAMLNTALKQNQSSMVSYLSKRVKANSETFVLLAKDNNEDLFEELIDNDNRVPDNAAVNVAIDNSNVKILNLALTNGGKANEALTYAISKDNLAMVKVIAGKKGVDASPAFKYAVNKSDEMLFTTLLAVPGADAKIGLDEAIKGKKTDLAILALETKKTSPTKYLKAAVEGDNIELAKKIVEVGGDANEGMEPAINKNNADLAEFLILNGATTTQPKYLESSSSLGNLEIVKLLVENGAKAANVKALANAITNNHDNVAEYLVEKGADPGVGIEYGALSGSLSIVKMMTEKGGDPTKGVLNAVSQNKVDVLRYLIENGGNISSSQLVATAVNKNYTDVFKLLVDNGAPVTGSGLLQTAAGYGNMPVVLVLLDNKFNPEDGMLPAIQKNRQEVFQLLIDKGAVPNKDEYVAAAVANKAANIIPILAAAGADFKKQDAMGNTYLHAATINNDPNTVSELLKAGTPLDAQNLKGNTALHLAADMTDRVPIIMILAKAGANLNIKNNNKNTPRDVAPGGSKSRKALKDLNAE